MFMYVFSERKAFSVAPSRILMTPSNPIYLVMKAPTSMKIHEKWSKSTGHFLLLNKLYLKILPIKLITKNSIINSNHQALYT